MKRCSRCRWRLRRSQFNVDRSSADGLRAACRSCRSQHEYRPRARRARSEKASPAARGGPGDDGEPRRVSVAAENGSAPLSDPLADSAIEAWLLEASFAQRRNGGLVATELGLELGTALDDSLAALAW
jgi:hypothetical protein